MVYYHLHAIQNLIGLWHLELVGGDPDLAILSLDNAYEKWTQICQWHEILYDAIFVYLEYKKPKMYKYKFIKVWQWGWKYWPVSDYLL